MDWSIRIGGVFVLAALLAVGCGGSKKVDDACGNGRLDPDELCDGSELDGRTCQSLGYTGGALACNSTCSFDVTACTQGGCGDGQRGEGEDCDGPDLGGVSCESLGFDGGELTCSQDCFFDDSGCSLGTCPNGQIDAGEECEGDDLNGQTCQGLGFDGGELACAANCRFDDSGCTRCQPRTCAELGLECGGWDDGCGTTLSCGDCPGGETCNQASGQCQAVCEPLSCGQLGRECGDWDDGCGTMLDCGDCPAGENCNGANGQCEVVCQPQTCAQMGRECGDWDDGCGTLLDCGDCPGGESCNAAGQCEVVCQPLSCAQMGYECGTWSDGCGVDLNCGSCTGSETCVDGTCLASPVLSLQTQTGGNFTLQWTYTWSGLASNTDHYSLEQSTTSPSSGFVETLQTPWNDRTSPWTETLSRANGSYYYRVRAYTAQGFSGYSNVVTVTVDVQPATLRIINDLPDYVAGPNDWGQLNRLFRIWIAGDENALQNCSDYSCDRLDAGSCGSPGQMLYPDPNGNNYMDFDVSMYQDGGYALYLDCGWWDYTCYNGSCCWEEHASTVVCCDGVSTCYKWTTVVINGHYDGVFELPLSSFLPQGNWYGSPFCN